MVPEDLYKLCAHTVGEMHARGMIITIATIYQELIYAKLRALHKLSHLILTTIREGRPYYFLQFENDEI